MTISSFLCPTTLYMGEGSYKKISEIVRKLQCQRLFIALDGALVESDFFTHIKKLLMAEGVARCAAAWPGQGIRISAQSHLERFYGGFGFVRTGPDYLEDNIPHCEMLRPRETDEQERT
jgi:hypothetical protein